MNERERMRRVDGERCQHRKDVLQEIFLEPRTLLFLDGAAVHQNDADAGELLAQFLPALLLIAREHRDGIGDSCATSAPAGLNPSGSLAVVIPSRT